jgi:hypothetical protein
VQYEVRVYINLEPQVWFVLDHVPEKKKEKSKLSYFLHTFISFYSKTYTKGELITCNSGWIKKESTGKP